MSCTHLFGGLFLAGAFLVHEVGTNPVAAQCSTCAAPAVAYTAAYAPAPVVYQTYRPTTGWYPGALLDRWRMNRWGANTTYTTAYAPTYATAYTAAYTPTYPPSYYGASYTAAYRPAYPIGYSVGYAPAVAYSPVTSCATCSVDPCACGSQPVVMRPIVDGCAICSACDAGSYVGQAVYESATNGCVGCATGPTSTYVAPSSPAPANGSGATPQPAIPPEQPVPEQRLRPEESPESEVKSVLEPPPAEKTDSNNGDADPSPPSTLFQPPELFNPGDRVTQRPNVPVWTAVYHSRGTAGQNAAQPVAKPQSTRPTAAEVERDAQGWASAGK